MGSFFLVTRSNVSTRGFPDAISRGQAGPEGLVRPSTTDGLAELETSRDRTGTFELQLDLILLNTQNSYGKGQFHLHDK